MAGPFQQRPTYHIEQFWMAFGTFKKSWPRGTFSKIRIKSTEFQQMVGPFQQRPKNGLQPFWMAFETF